MGTLKTKENVMRPKGDGTNKEMSRLHTNLRREPRRLQSVNYSQEAARCSAGPSTHHIMSHAPFLFTINMILRTFLCSQREHDCRTNDLAADHKTSTNGSNNCSTFYSKKTGSNQSVSLSDSRTSLKGNKGLHTFVCAPPSTRRQKHR